MAVRLKGVVAVVGAAAWCTIGPVTSAAQASLGEGQMRLEHAGEKEHALLYHDSCTSKRATVQ